MDRKTIGVALSGGGFRASLWGLGALLYLEDAGCTPDIETISSVSGGSITNGVLASTDGDIRERSRKLVSLATDDGLFLFGPSTNPYMRTLLVTVTLALTALLTMILTGLTAVVRALLELVGITVSLPSLPGIAGLMLMAAFIEVRIVVGKAAGRPDPIFTVISMVIAIIGLVLLIVAFAQPAVFAWLTVVWWALFTFVLIGVAAWVFSRRSMAAERALIRELFSRDGHAIEVAELDRAEVLHVFCATELQSGIHTYISPRFISNYRFGNGTPNGMTLATAVQCSLALPGAFRPRIIDTEPFQMRTVVSHAEPHAPIGEPMVLADGGVYDNMGVSWFVGIPDRARTWGDRTLEEPDLILVANASAGWEWRPMRSLQGLGLEVGTFGKVSSVMYETTTRPRREHLINEWKLRDWGNLKGPRGAIINIDRSPYRLAAENLDTKNFKEKAERVIPLINDVWSRSAGERVTAGLDPESWEQIARENSQFPTTLRAVGRDTAQRLLWHSYILTAVACHLFADVPLPERFPTRKDLVGIDGDELVLNPPVWWDPLSRCN